MLSGAMAPDYRYMGAKEPRETLKVLAVRSQKQRSARQQRIAGIELAAHAPTASFQLPSTYDLGTSRCTENEWLAKMPFACHDPIL